MSSVLTAVKDDLDSLGDLTGHEASLAATAVKLAASIDAGGGEDGKYLAAQAKELRATLAELFGARGGDEDDEEDPLGDVGTPV